MKKLLVSLLCVVMMVTFMPSMAFADVVGQGTNQTAPPAAENKDATSEANQGGTDIENGQAPEEGIPDEDVVAIMTQGDATIGSYKSVGDALKNVKDYSYSENKTEYVIELQKDTKEDIVIPTKKRIVIDLNGCQITNVISHTIYNNGTNIKVIDTKGGGVIDNTTHGKAAVYNNINASITLQGGTFSRSAEASTGDSASGGNSFYVLKNFGTMYIKTGTTVKFSDTNPGLYSSLVGNGWQDAAAAEAGKNGEPKPSDGKNKATLIIYDGATLTGGQITVKNDDYGVLEVKGGTITQPSEGRAAIANNNVAKITGGEIEASGVNGQAVYSRYFNTNGANKGELTISGGSFKAAGTVIDAQKGSKLSVTDGVFETTGKDSYIFTVDETAESSITNGTYKGVTVDKVSNNENAFEEGYAPQQDKDGNIVVDVTDEGASAVIISKDGTEKKYVKAQDAGKALKDGETLKLLKDYTSTPDYNWGISISAADVTVDLNGYSVTSNKETTSNSSGYAIKFSRPASGAKNHTVTIKNSGDKQSVLTSCLYQIYAQSGNSKYNVIVKLEGDIVLKDTNPSEEALGIMLDTGAKLLDTETARKLVPNGGFSVKEADGNNYIYGDYAHALDKSTDKYVRMIHDYTTNSSISSGNETGTLDLGDHTYTYTGSGAAIDVNYPNVTLTVKNGKVVATNESCDGAHLIGAPTTSQMNNRGLILDKVELTVPGDVYGIVTNGTETGNKITLKDSVLNVTNGIGIYFPSTGDVVIDNSIINAKYTGVQMCAGNLTVKGGKTAITTTEKPQEKLEGDGAIADGAAISIVEREGYKDLGTVTIEGGTFKAAEGVDSIKTYTFNNTDKTEGEWAEAGEVVDVVGGSFSTAVPENICGEHFMPTEVDPDTGMATVKRDDKAPTISGIENKGIYYRESVTFTVSDDNKVASVKVDGKEVSDSNGEYTITGTGTHTVVARDSAKNETTVTVELKNGKGTITAEGITLGEKLTYNGKEQTQTIKVVVDGVTLTEGTDYKVTGNKAVKAGKYTLTVAGIGNYEGTVEVAYEIAEKPYIPPTPSKQYPTIEKNDDVIVTLGSYGTTATIKVKDGYEIVDVTVNGVSKGAVTTLTGLKTGDKVVITTISTAEKEELEKNEKIKAGVKATEVKAWSKRTSKGIKVYFKKSYGYKVDGYEIYRSTKKSTFGKKPYYVSKNPKAKYLNNTKSLKKGTYYFYKVRGYRTVGGEKVYTQWSNQAIRKAR